MRLDEYKKAIREGKEKIKSPAVTDIKREPTHPGEILEEEFMKPLGLTQSKLAKELGVSTKTISDIIHKKRGITPYMAIKFSERFGTSPEFWLGLQMDYYLWKAYNKHKKKSKRPVLNK
ncbi:HigA family addiction module antitoxin [Persephonella sp.]